MKYIFIVDDSRSKLLDIRDTLKSIYPKAEFFLYSCRNDFVQEIHSTHYHKLVSNPLECLAVIDMCLPVYPETAISSTCGYSILRAMHNKGDLISAMFVSTDKVDDERAKRSYKGYIGSIEYKALLDQTQEFKQLLSVLYY